MLTVIEENETSYGPRFAVTICDVCGHCDGVRCKLCGSRYFHNVNLSTRACLPQLIKGGPESLRRIMQCLRVGFLWIHTPRLNPYLKDSVAARRTKTMRRLFCRLCQIQAERIEAIAQISWCVEAFTGEDVAQVRFAVSAKNFNSRHTH